MNYTLRKVQKGDSSELLFNELVYKIYKNGSSRFNHGHEAVNEHLQGCYILLNGEEVLGRFAIYLNDSLHYKKYKTALIGSYECINNTDIGKELVRQAKEIAKSFNCNYLIGPMEGSTWNSYRFADNFDNGTFFTEPFHQSYYSQQFLQSGFEPIAQYVSYSADIQAQNQSFIDRWENSLSKSRYRIRNFNMKLFDQELQKLADFSNNAFANNFLFTPIDSDTFKSKYTELRSLIDPKLIWIVENNDEEIEGISFCLKNHEDPSGESIIFKTLARRQDTKINGLGGYLTMKSINEAHKLGFKKMIHAFMKKENQSASMSIKLNGLPFKNYSLFGLPL